jgi:hypothetical protein
MRLASVSDTWIEMTRGGYIFTYSATRLFMCRFYVHTRPCIEGIVGVVIWLVFHVLQETG